MKARRWLQMWLVLLIASGCAQRADWIQGTLVTVDVAGRWTGTFSRVGGDPGASAGGLDMTLRQTGPRATGDVRLLAATLNSGTAPSRGPSMATSSSSVGLTAD